MTPDEVLQRYPGVTVRWLRGRLGLTPEAFALQVGVAALTVARWEAGQAPIRRAATYRRLVPLLAPQLQTDAGRAWLRTLGTGEREEG